LVSKKEKRFFARREGAPDSRFLVKRGKEGRRAGKITCESSYNVKGDANFQSIFSKWGRERKNGGSAGKRGRTAKGRGEKW